MKKEDPNKEITAIHLSEHWNIPKELADSLAEMGEWVDNEDGTVSFRNL